MVESGMHQHLSQRIVAGAAMQRKLAILQASGMELDHLIREIVDSNPVLEMQSSDEAVSIDLLGDESGDDGDTWEDRSKGDYYYESLVAPETLASSLKEQIFHSSLPGEIEHAVCLMIDSLDDRGFFEEAPAVIMETHGISADVGEAALLALRDMEPAGVGAVDVRGSLLIQLSREGEQGSLAFLLVESCWDDLVKHRYDDAASTLGVERSDVLEALERIKRLNPDPGANFRSGTNPYITADVIVERNEVGEWDVRLTGTGVPVLSVNDDYKEIMAESSDNPTLREYLKKAFSEARELMNDLSTRQETILKLAWILVSRQRDYFDQGIKGLKPLGMEAAAEELNVSISTVSRAVSGKYLLGPWGYRELRTFFSSGVEKRSSLNDGGESMAMEAVQSLILDMIKHEDASHPLSDAVIAERLASENGLKISRRTVAKYRDLMKILPASLRKA